jgi:hypothetical protein
MSMLKYLIPLIAAMASCGRSDAEPLTCAEPGTAQGVDLTIVDSTTGSPFPFYDLYATATDGAYRDSLGVSAITAAPAHVYWLASDREGTYAVTVQARGYQRWAKTGIVVSRSECRIVPAVLTVRLQPVP